MTEFKRGYTTVSIGERSIRHKVRIDDLVDTNKGSVEARIRMHRILDMLVTTPDLMAVGPASVPDSAVLRHDGTHWVLELEAVSTEIGSA